MKTPMVHACVHTRARAWMCCTLKGPGLGVWKYGHPILEGTLPRFVCWEGTLEGASSRFLHWKSTLEGTLSRCLAHWAPERALYHVFIYHRDIQEGTTTIDSALDLIIYDLLIRADQLIICALKLVMCLRIRNLCSWFRNLCSRVNLCSQISNSCSRFSSLCI